MSGEVSYCSRFFAKFVEIIAAGLASALTAYLLAHFGGVLLYATPASAPVAPIASEVAESRRAQPIPVVAAAPVNERRTVPQKDTDAPAAQLAPNGGKEAKTLPLRKHTKTDTSVAEKEPRGQKSLSTRRSRCSPVRRPAPTCSQVPPRSGPPSTRSPQVQRPSRLQPTWTRTCSQPSNGSRICCGPTRLRPPAKPRVRPCRSGQRHLKRNSEIEPRAAKVPVGRQKLGDIRAQLISISG
jgi:hypothetical protein